MFIDQKCIYYLILFRFFYFYLLSIFLRFLLCQLLECIFQYIKNNFQDVIKNDFSCEQRIFGFFIGEILRVVFDIENFNGEIDSVFNFFGRKKNEKLFSSKYELFFIEKER